jgi:glyoxylase-like metal-dependent hydrolase (beta-lactamase superfamily II)
LGNAANQNFISNAGFVIAPEGVVVIDALGSPAVAQRLVDAIKTITPKPITHLILTHYHADHIYGVQVFKDLGARVMAHESGKVYLNSADAQTRLIASRVDMAPWVNADTRLVAADEWINGPVTRTLAGMVFQIDPVGPAHTPDDLAIWVASEGVLFSGDLIFSGRLPFVGKADSSHWVTSLDHLLSYDAKAVVPGHGRWSADPRKDISMMRDYLKYLRQTMGEAADALVPFDEAYAQTDWRDWETVPMFKFANRMNAYNTYLLKEQEGLQGK